MRREAVSSTQSPRLTKEKRKKKKKNIGAVIAAFTDWADLHPGD